MKSRFILIITLLFLGSVCIAQPTEVTYLGNVIKSGYAVEESYGPFNIGFNFTFYGNTYDEFYVNSSGLVLFGAGSIDGTEDPIPTTDAPNNYIAPLWDQLIISSSGKMLYTTIGTAPNRKLIIQGTNMGFYPYPIFMGTYLVILYETSNKIQFQYRIIVDATSERAHGGSATIGIENSTGTDGVQYAWHNPAAITTGQAISFTPSGSTYTINPNDIYYGVVLTTNLTLPDPGIPLLLNPPQDAVIGSDYTFEWAESSYAESYTLLLSHFSDLGGATSYNAGTNLSYYITGLTLDTTYYWGVFATNATGTTWCEIKRFTTTSAPPLFPVSITVWTEQGQDKTIKLNYTGGDASPKTAIITSLPAQGALYQYNAGTRGSLISSVPTTITDPNRNVIYAATGSYGNGVGNFHFKINDASGDSPEGTITVNVSPPGVPDVLYIAKSTNVEIQLDMIMADPTGKQSQFEVKVNSTPVTINSAALKTGDPYTIVLALSPALTGTETVLVSYTMGDVTSAVGGFLLSFTDESVTLTAQTINFAQSLTRKYNESPLTLTATASSGLGITYSSSNPSVATASGNKLTFHSLGTSEITARQSGNATYAPAKFIKPLTVSKGDQTITFDPLPEKSYGDTDFNPGATASSGLTVTYSSDNPDVATINGGMINIVSPGTALITASQSGSPLYNPATPVEQTLTVNKADLTFTADDKTRPYLEPNPELTYTITGFLFDDDESDLDILPGIETSAVQDSPVDDYPITFTGGSDNNYNYVFVDGVLTLTKIDQTITFTSVPQRLMITISYTLAATSTSGLTVLFESLNTQIAQVSGDQLTGVSKGTVEIRAYHPGDQNYNPAETTAYVEFWSTHRDIMNLFTPNNDGVNDLWEIPDLLSYGKCDVRIYNRWGKLVFSSPDYDNTWNGTSDGTDLPEGAYYFVIKTQNAGTITGTVNIVR